VSAKEATICYVEGGASLTVREICSWNRGDIEAIVAGSNGPKDYIKNQIFAVFESNPRINRIVMVRASGPAFVLLRDVDNCWFDATGKQVTTVGSPSSASVPLNQKSVSSQNPQAEANQ
jgi:hypothetical protein